MQANHFSGHAGDFASHPSSGHDHAVLMFHQSQPPQQLLSDYDAVARTLVDLDLASKVMVARVNLEVNAVMKERFRVEALPSFVWLTRGDQDWLSLTVNNPDDLVKQIREQVSRTE